MSNVPSAYAYLRILADSLPLEEISELLGVRPTESWQKGDPAIYVREKRNSAWCLHSPLPKTNTCLSNAQYIRQQ
jgi:hypothetical protein